MSKKDKKIKKLKSSVKVLNDKVEIQKEIIHWQRAENAKLRKLMRDTYDCICEMYRYVDGGYAYEDAEADPAYGPILKRMRELGVEVK